MIHWKDRWFNDWDEGFDFAQKQAITGIVFKEIEESPSYIASMPEMLLFQWIGSTEQIKHQNHVLDKEVETLAALLDQHQIRYAVVKGQVVASYYDKPKYRQSGDIDFYIPQEDAEKAKEVIEDAWQVEMDKGDSAKHYDFKHNGVTYEMHFRLFEWHQAKKERYWHEILHNAMNYRVKIGETQVATLEPTVHTLYVFLHLYHHLIEVGVGLRQFCDLAMMLKADIDREQLKRYLEDFGMKRAFRACEYIIGEKLELPKEYLLYDIRGIDRWFGRKILDIVMYRGNMGHYNKRGGWKGLRHKVESTGIKLSHFMKLWWLSPGYHVASLRHKLLG
ncbi:MAG: nucleotidyltransferase family protein [Prevotella sp.]|nr:nucleotidyltransferase family protein [Prevotella sp.]